MNRRAVSEVVTTFILVAIAVVGGTIIFVFSQGYFATVEIEPIEDIEVDYLEVKTNIIFHDKSANKMFTASYGNDIDYNSWNENLWLEDKISKGHTAIYKDNEYFNISYWQPEKGNLDDGVDSWYQIVTHTNLNNEVVITYIVDVVPQDDCLNLAVCFDDLNKPLLVIITPLDENLIIDIDGIYRHNTRVLYVEQLDDSRIIIALDPYQLMPETEKHHVTVPQFSLWIPINVKDESNCFWDPEPRVCELELKVKELEVRD